MTTSKLCLLLCLLTLPASAFAAEHAATSTPPASVSAAGEVVMSSPADSAGAAEGLPDLPPVQPSILSFRAAPAEQTLRAERPARLSFGSPQSRGVSVLASMPLAGAARHLGAQHFNTDDGSMLDDFAICYRMTSRSSIEIIPGDPAPVKLPVVTLANNTGVTVGLVLRLSK